MRYIFLAVVVLVIVTSFALIAQRGTTPAHAQQPVPKPANVTAINGPNAGEAIVRWTAEPGYNSHRVGWLAVADFQAYPDIWAQKFAYSDVEHSSTWTITRLSPGVDYYFIVGRKFEGELEWSAWTNPPLTLNADGQACPTDAGPAPLPTATDGEYDVDNDGLIEIRTVAQLDAMRYDLDGDGLLITDTAAYNAAFPRPASGSMGCPNDNCTGYELADNLSFDTNGNGQIDQGDQFWNGGAGWVPIGNSSSPFNATFDGAGFSISNLYINRDDTSNIGLFGVADAGSTIRQVSLTSVKVLGRSQVGGLVGYNRNGAEVLSSYSTGNVEGHDDVGGLVGRNQHNGNIVASFSDGSVAAFNEHAGGLVGANYNDATISASYSNASVNGNTHVGGLLGRNYTNATISASYATGDVDGSSAVGGLVGENDSATVAASYATGRTSGTGGLVGGLVGYNRGGAISASYATGSVHGAGDRVGGLVGLTQSDGTTTASYWDVQTSGQTDSDGGEPKTTQQLQSPTQNTGIYSGWDADIWHFPPATQYPRLKYGGLDVTLQLHTAPPKPTLLPPPTPMASATDGEYDVDNDGLIDVRNLAQLDAMRYDLDGDGLLITDTTAYDAAFPRPASGSMGCPNDACTGYELADNLSFDTNGNGEIGTGDQFWNGGAGWVPIGNSSSPFNATFDGAGFSISNLYINRDDTSNIGLFGVADAGSTIRQVSLTSVKVLGRSQVGGLVGYNRNGAEVLSSYSTGNVEGHDDVGGLVGRNQHNGNIVASFSDGSVAAFNENAGGLVGANYNDATISASYANASVNGNTHVGGLLGRNYTNATISASYATGDVDGLSAVGGLVGENDSATVAASYATGRTSGTGGLVGGLVGYNTNGGAITASYAVGSVRGTGDRVGGLVGLTQSDGTTTASYWDVQTSGQTDSDGGEPKTTSQLQSPTGYAGIYADWNVDLDNIDLDDDLATGGDDPWDFRTSREYPAIKYDGSSDTTTASTGTGTQPGAIGTGTETGTGTTTDRAALVALYNATDGPNWRYTSGWNTEALPREWYGVTTDEQGQVIGLDLSGNGLEGTIPAELGGLDYLEWLNLRGNSLTGAIPPELGGLTSLIWMDLSGNELTGAIRTELGDLRNLTRLYLSGNDLGYPRGEGHPTGHTFSGEIPAELSNLFNLRVLDLSNNHLVGNIPGELSGLDELIVLDLSDNNLNGTIPAELGGITKLGRLHLQRNQLSGEIPGALGMLTSLTDLELNGNQLSGEIPAQLFDNSVAQNRSSVMYVGGNNLQVLRSTQLTSLPSLRNLNLGGNLLLGGIPAEIGGLSALESLDLSDNFLQGEIPPQLSRVRSLKTLSLSNNLLSGQMPQFLAEFRYLGVLLLDGNRFTGCTSNSLLNRLFNAGYWFTPPLCTPEPAEQGDPTPGGTSPAPNGNDQKALQAFYRTTSESDWAAIRDSLQCSTDPYGVDDLSELCGVTTDPDSGRVTGLALRTGACTIYLVHQEGCDQPQLKGNIPSDIGSLSELSELDLSYNCLDGEIPSEIGNLKKLTVLNLSHNRDVVRCAPVNDTLLIGGLISLVGSVRGDFKGFYGPIPSELGGLPNLTELNLSHNLLEGEIPDSLGGLTNLRSLFLNDNSRLTGNIWQMTSLDSLRVLNISNNSLSGDLDQMLLAFSLGDQSETRMANITASGNNWESSSGTDWSNVLNIPGSAVSWEVLGDAAGTGLKVLTFTAEQGGRASRLFSVPTAVLGATHFVLDSAVAEEIAVALGRGERVDDVIEGLSARYVSGPVLVAACSLAGQPLESCVSQLSDRFLCGCSQGFGCLERKHCIAPICLQNGEIIRECPTPLE